MKGKIFYGKIRKKELVDKSDVSRFIDNSDLDKKVVTLATNAELKADQDKIVKLQEFSVIYYSAKSDFED